MNPIIKALAMDNMAKEKPIIGIIVILLNLSIIVIVKISPVMKFEATNDKGLVFAERALGHPEHL